MKILVTGASGQLGQPVYDRLAAAGHAVRGTDLRGGGAIEAVDLLDREGCDRLVRGMDVVVHLANHPGEVLADVRRLYRENGAMNVNVVQAAMEAGVGKPVFASSIQVMTGESRERVTCEPDPVCRLPYLPVDGEVPPCPGNLYALSKKAGEDLLAYAARVAGLQCIAVRFPWLVPEPVAVVREWAAVREAPMSSARINEAFSALCLGNAAELVECIVARELPGFRRYLPAARSLLTSCPLEALLDGVYAGIPLRVPRASLDRLVDPTVITEDTGWVPGD